MVQNCRTVHRLLAKEDKGDGINFLQLVINPDDYGQTVENMFYASFLIKEGHAGIQLEDDGQIIIRMLINFDWDIDRLIGSGNEKDRLADESADIPKNQAVMELDMDTWRVSSCHSSVTLQADYQEAIKVLKIKKPLIPHREYGLENTARPEANGWYN
jgi:hypothetical protein